MSHKYKVFFRRVSSKGQDLAMQESADALYRNKYIPKEILIIDENDTSANKLKIADRPQMMKLIWMILNDQVDIVYAFDRTRLFRDFYEANYFISICRKKNVRIFFTSAGNGHHQSTDNTLIEGVLSIVSDIEGKNIARRTEEARKRYPPKKFGFIKHKETKQYKKDPEKADILESYFTALTEISSSSELEELIQVYKKALKTSPEALIRMARDPFYAGYDLTNGKNKLHHVEPYLNLAQHENLQNKKSLLSKYEDKKAELIDQNIYQPFCGYCQNPMKFRYNITSRNAWYTCSKKHSKVSISASDLSKIISFSLDKIIGKLDIEKLMNDTKQFFQGFKKSLNEDLNLLKTNKKGILKEIIIKNENLQNWREHPLYRELIILEEKIEHSLSEIDSAEQLFLKNRRLAELITNYLHNSNASNPYFLCSMLIENLFVYPNEVNLEVNRFSYIQDIEKSLIYEGGMLLCKD